jgi:23S rRNA (adenine2503-C2)-methyltransferase
MAEPTRPNLLGLSRAELAAALAPVVDRPYRARQIFDAIYLRGITAPSAMTDLSLELRRELEERFSFAPPTVERQETAADGTTKYLLRLVDGASIEAVDIAMARPAPAAAPAEEPPRTLCISSQAGCALACRFCVTGYWGAGRNLTAGEIVGQVLAIRQDRERVAIAKSDPGLPRKGQPQPSFNLVFMGMGEPLLNLDNLSAALDILGETISPRRVTVSTAGIVPGIDSMAAWPRRPKLAISLHAPDDARRNEIMPINRTYPLAELMAALHRYPLENGRRLTFEYILIKDFNAAPTDADALVRLLHGLRAKVNLIPLNPDPVLGDLEPPADSVVDAFRLRLERRGLVATVRRRRGDAVSAACGQLRAFGRAPKTFAGRQLGR